MVVGFLDMDRGNKVCNTGSSVEAAGDKVVKQ